MVRHRTVELSISQRYLSYSFKTKHICYQQMGEQEKFNKDWKKWIKVGKEKQKIQN